jgi:hypothetical protein
LPRLPREQRSLHKCIDADDSQDWWQEWRVKKHLAEMHPAHLKRVTDLKKGKELSVGTIYRRVRYGKSRSEIRTDGLAGCLRTPRGGSSKQIVFTAGKGKVRMRWMTPREYARLHHGLSAPGFPKQILARQPRPFDERQIMVLGPGVINQMNDISYIQIAVRALFHIDFSAPPPIGRRVREITDSADQNPAGMDRSRRSLRANQDWLNISGVGHVT